MVEIKNIFIVSYLPFSSINAYQVHITIQKVYTRLLQPQDAQILKKSHATLAKKVFSLKKTLNTDYIPYICITAKYYVLHYHKEQKNGCKWAGLPVPLYT